MAHENPLFKGLPGQYDDPETQKIANEAHRRAGKILDDWAEQKMKGMADGLQEKDRR